jgi:hypothetical protein
VGFVEGARFRGTSKYVAKDAQARWPLLPLKVVVIEPGLWGKKEKRPTEGHIMNQLSTSVKEKRAIVVQRTIMVHNAHLKNSNPAD